MSAPLASLSWFSIIRIGLVQTALGAVVVLCTSTLNRVMVIEVGLPAMVPGALVAFHYAIQILRPRWGHGSDNGGRRTPWIIGGMLALALGGPLAAVAVALMTVNMLAGTALAVLAYGLIGLGVGAAGTSLLVFLAERVAPARRAASATVVWLMMIAGFVITAGTAGHLLEPFSMTRLVAVSAGASAVAFTVALLAIWGLEARAIASGYVAPPRQKGAVSFGTAFREVWSEPQARMFTMFIFAAMLAYNAQELLLEPFAGAIFGMTPGESTRLGGVHHAGVFAGMILVAVLALVLGKGSTRFLSLCMVVGCVASAFGMLGIATAGLMGPPWPLPAAVAFAGVANGIMTTAAISCMMALARSGHASREGVRMGIWGAAQAIAFALGGFSGTVAVDVARRALGQADLAYGIVFGGEAATFLLAAFFAAAVARTQSSSMKSPSVPLGALLTSSASGR